MYFQKESIRRLFNSCRRQEFQAKDGARASFMSDYRRHLAANAAENAPSTPTTTTQESWETLDDDDNDDKGSISPTLLRRRKVRKHVKM